VLADGLEPHSVCEPQATGVPDLDHRPERIVRQGPANVVEDRPCECLATTLSDESRGHSHAKVRHRAVGGEAGHASVVADAVEADQSAGVWDSQRS
jgi:hypothetical protein